AGKTPTREQWCTLDGKDALNTLELGFPQLYEGRLLNEMLVSACFDKEFKVPQDALARFTKFRAQFPVEAAYLRGLEIDRYLPQHAGDFRVLDNKVLGIEESSVSAFFAPLTWFWQSLPNSSTNFDRKRASYMLKRFFCDDLTPINILAPEGHGGKDRHASE